MSGHSVGGDCKWPVAGSKVGSFHKRSTFRFTVKSRLGICVLFGVIRAFLESEDVGESKKRHDSRAKGKGSRKNLSAQRKKSGSAVLTQLSIG